MIPNKFRMLQKDRQHRLKTKAYITNTQRIKNKPTPQKKRVSSNRKKIYGFGILT